MNSPVTAAQKTAEWKQLAKLTGPILIAQLTQTMMSVVDTVMAGRVSATDLAAVSVGSSIWIPQFCWCLVWHWRWHLLFRILTALVITPK